MQEIYERRVKLETKLDGVLEHLVETNKSLGAVHKNLQC